MMPSQILIVREDGSTLGPFEVTHVGPRTHIAPNIEQVEITAQRTTKQQEEA